MSDSSRDRRLPGDLYHAAVDPGRWPELLDRIARTMGARGAAILSMDLHRADGYGFASTCRLFDNEHRALYEREYKPSERDHLVLVASSEPRRIVVGSAFETDRRTGVSRPDVRFLREHYGIDDRFGIRVNEDGGRVDCLACQHAEARGDIEAHEAAALMPLVPHLSQTLLLAR